MAAYQLSDMYFTSQDITARRQKLAAKWDELLNTGEAVLVYSGEPIQKPGGLDQNYDFIPHPAYFWLTGRRRESEVLLYSKDMGWVEFQKDIPAEEAVWEGERKDLLFRSLVSRKRNSMTWLRNFHRYIVLVNPAHR